MLKVLILLIILCIHDVVGWSQGAPIGSCNSMRPSHHTFEPQEGLIPIDVILPERIYSGKQILVIIRDNSGQGFRGYKILARNQANNDLVGRFLETDVSQTIACGGREGTAATQRNASLITEVKFTWEAPGSAETINFNFIITIVQTFSIFWINHRLPAVLIPDDDFPNQTQPPENTTPDNEIDDIYNGCDVTKTCFGIPQNCHTKQNCAMFGAVTYNNYNFTFELLSMNNHNYIAMGLSNTQQMADTSVIECVRASSSVRSFSSWTIGIEEARRDNIDQNIITLVDYSLVNGRIYCKVQRKSVSVVNGTTFDLENNKYYLLIASGRDVNSNSVGFHDDEAYSDKRVLLTVPQIVAVGKSQNPLMLTHGALMFIAWIGFTSIGVVIARYFKTAWSGAKIFGKDVWFIWHVICMFFTWSFTIIGFILIFAYRGEWRTSAHAIMGCVVLFFTVLQPIGAIFRPDPQADSRPLFNWLHKAFGNITHALAIITIFYAVRFPRVGLPQYTLYILAAFVSFYLLMHIILTSLSICGQIRQDEKSNKATKFMPFQILQKTLLGFFVTVIIIFVVMLNVVFMLDLE